MFWFTYQLLPFLYKTVKKIGKWFHIQNSCYRMFFPLIPYEYGFHSFIFLHLLITGKAYLLPRYYIKCSIYDPEPFKPKCWPLNSKALQLCLRRTSLCSRCVVIMLICVKECCWDCDVISRVMDAWRLLNI